MYDVVNKIKKTCPHFISSSFNLTDGTSVDKVYIVRIIWTDVQTDGQTKDNNYIPMFFPTVLDNVLWSFDMKP